MASATIGDRAFFLGGSRCMVFSGCNSSLDTDWVEVYDGATGQFTGGPYLALPRADPSAAAADGVLVCAGGVTLPGTITDHVDIYDSNVGPPSDPAAWSVSALPAGPRTNMAAVALGSKVYFAGGIEPVFNASDLVEVYDTSTGTWSTAQLSAPRMELTGTSVGSKVLFAGGNVGGTMSDVVDIYDGVTDLWTTATLSLARTQLSSAAAGGKALFLGGRLTPGPSSQASDVTDRVDVYDEATNTWSMTSMPLGRSRTSAAVVGDLVLCAGGRSPIITNHVDVYDVSSATWTSTSFPGQGRNTVASASLPGRAVFAGGFTCCTGGGSLNASAEVSVFRADGSIGTHYCGPAAPNSTGTSATIGATGLTTAALDLVTLEASDMPLAANGYFLGSQQQGFVAMPGNAQGNLCLGGHVGRYNRAGEVFDTGSTGTGSLVLELANTPSPMGIIAIQPGETWSFQAWYRDSVGGSATSNFTDGLQIDFD